MVVLSRCIWNPQQRENPLQPEKSLQHENPCKDPLYHLKSDSKSGLWWFSVDAHAPLCHPTSLDSACEAHNGALLVMMAVMQAARKHNIIIQVCQQ